MKLGPQGEREKKEREGEETERERKKACRLGLGSPKALEAGLKEKESA